MFDNVLKILIGYAVQWVYKWGSDKNKNLIE